MTRQQKVNVAQELDRVCAANGGVLRCADVVAEAESDASPLHNYFQWDDSKAAHAYRLWQARELIVSVTVQLKGAKRRAQVFVSLKTDRGDGGYRRLVEVLQDSEMRAQLLTDALEDLRLFEAKYRRLKELVPIFRAARRLRKKMEAA